jgi:hypothetical protein
MHKLEQNLLLGNVLDASPTCDEIMLMENVSKT